MSSDDYQVQNVYRYARKSYKKNNCKRGSHGNDRFCSQDNANVESDQSPRSDAVAMDMPSCSCDVTHEGAVASILHKKSPVIMLAREQLTRLLDETDKIIRDNTEGCRSLYDFLCLCREVCLTQNKFTLSLIFLIAVAFLIGIFIGAASCGSYLGQFNSPILTCIDNFFISETYTNIEKFRGIV